MYTTLADWLTHLEAQHPRAIDLGLERIRPVAVALGVTQLDCPVITVGGTNGKGSTVAMLTAMLCAAGYKTGTYTSPHILVFNERVAINQQLASDQQLLRAFAAVEQARAACAISLTYFEFTTLAAFWLFKDAAVQVAVLEVGLGGRLDAVNLLDADVAVITSIGIDHVDWLGNTRELIASEKAGICRPGKPLVCGDLQPPQTLLEQATAFGCPLQLAGRDFWYTEAGNDWEWQGRSETLRLPRPALALANAATAVAALRCLHLPVSLQAMRTGLQQARLAGRCERHRHNGVEIVLDVAHNPHGAAFFMQQLQPIAGKTLAVFAMLHDKDIAGTLDACLGRVDRWFIASLGVPRGAAASALLPLLLERGMPAAAASANVRQALLAALAAAQAGDRILVFGSFYTVAAARQWLEDFHGYSN